MNVLPPTPGVRQDGAPRSGFPEVRYGRVLPNVSQGSPFGALYVGLTCAVVGAGFYGIYRMIKHRTEHKHER